MKYFVTIKAKRKNAKRHIYNAFKRAYNSLEEAEREAESAPDFYTVEIWTGNWQFVKEVKR